ncbi:MAG: hypothetical protein WA697_22980, partial [Pseudolabrys sp.]
GFAGHFARASCLVIHSGDARTSGVMSASAITSGAALPTWVQIIEVTKVDVRLNPDSPTGI